MNTQKLMAFLKKNWGFLLFSLAALGCIGFLLANCLQTGSVLNSMMQGMQQKEKELDRMKRKRLAFTQENIDVARRNAREMDDKWKEMRKELAERYRIDPKLTDERDTFAALNRLKRELGELDEFLEKKGVARDEGVANYTFQNIVGTRVPLKPEDLVPIFRCLEIVKRVTGFAAEAGVSSLNALKRPHGNASEEQDYRVSYPVEITVTGSVESLQRYLNMLTFAPKNFIVIRSVKISAPNAYTEVASAFAAGKLGGETKAIEQSEGPSDTGRRRRRRVQSQEPEEGMAGSVPSAGAGRVAGEEGWVPVPVRRNDYLALRERVGVMSLRLDVFEFKPLEGQTSEAEGEDTNAAE